MQRAGLEFLVNYEPISEPIYVDHDMWEKIVLNLISNAFKFTFQGTVSVSVRSTDGRVELEVRDTGTGIPADEIPHIFERFHRAASAKGRSFEGTGIGLALVQELAKLHKGSINVHSTVGEGSCFTVEIPRGKDHLPQDRIAVARTTGSSSIRAESYVEEALRWLGPETPNVEQDRKEIKPDPTASTISPFAEYTGSVTPELIVLADDNADMRGYLRRLLSDRYRVHAVSNGADALNAVRQLNPDLILADVMMPKLDGFGLLKALRGDPANKLKPVILLSARAGEEPRVEGLEAGADDYLVKPFTARELLARVGAHLKMARVRNEAAERERRLRAEVELARTQVLEEKVQERTAELQQARESLRTLNHELLLAQEEERRRLALDLHDGAGQWLVALKWKLGSLPAQVRDQGGPLVQGLSDSLKLLDSLSQELRTVSHLLHPPLLEQAGLPVALRQYVAGLFDRSGLAIDLQIDPTLQRKRLSPDIEATVFRIVQEALTNVHRHAKTKTSMVQINATSTGINVRVEDKGHGIPGFQSLDNPNVKLGVGIQGMRERVRQVGGSFDLQSGPGGTTVSVVVPMRWAA
jgi:signal transduction histidine kinase